MASKTAYGWELKDGYANAAKDIVLFNKWAKAELGTKECIFLFAKNNDIRGLINEGDFVRWLSQLGWKR